MQWHNIYDYRNSFHMSFSSYNYEFLSSCLQLFSVLYQFILLVYKEFRHLVFVVVVDPKGLFMTCSFSANAFTSCDIILCSSLNKVTFTL